MLGLGALAAGDAVFAAQLSDLADRLLKVSNVHVSRAVPLMLALPSLSRPEPALIDELARMAIHSDPTMCYNALVALGLVGCGTCNAKVAAALRHCI